MRPVSRTVRCPGWLSAGLVQRSSPSSPKSVLEPRSNQLNYCSYCMPGEGAETYGTSLPNPAQSKISGLSAKSLSELFAILGGEHAAEMFMFMFTLVSLPCLSCLPCTWYVSSVVGQSKAEQGRARRSRAEAGWHRALYCTARIA